MEHPLHSFRYCPLCGSADFVCNDEKSKRCATCGFTYYFNPSSACVALILNSKGELLVARRAQEPARGTLDLPGGFCDCFETLEQGVCREVKEETGLDVCAAEYLFSLPNIYPYSGFRVHTVDAFFLCRVSSDEGLCAMDDVAELRWVALRDLRPEQFGLTSIRQGVANFLAKNTINKV